MIHQSVMELIEYPNTLGKIMAMRFFNWEKLTKDEEVLKVREVLKMAREIDSQI